MKIYFRILTVVLAGWFLSNFDAAAQSNEKEMAAPLKKAYAKRTVVIKKDTVTYRHRWFIPGQYKVQYAGSIGYMSIGFGYSIGEVYKPSLFFGYLDEGFGDSKNSVVTIALKNSFYLKKKPILDVFYPYGGLMAIWGNTNNTFQQLPEYYPEKYYFQNKFHLFPYVGGELKFLLNGRYFNGVGIYSEFAAMDAYLLEAIRTEYVKFDMIWSMSVGVTFYLR